MNKTIENTDKINEQFVKLLREDRLEELLASVQECKPQYLYKYIPLDVSYDHAILTSLKKGQLYFSRLTDFDDTDEYSGIELPCQSEDMLKGSQAYFRDNIRKDWVCCFCGETSVESLLWVHYANCCKGFRLKFKVNDWRYIAKVIYTDLKYKARLVKNIEQQNSPEIKRNRIIDILYRYTKKSCWHGQNEYRIIIDSGNWLANFFYSRYRGYAECDLELEKITIGYGCSEENKAFIFEIAQKQNVTVEQGLSPSFEAAMCRPFYERYNLTTDEIDFIEKIIKTIE